MIRPEFEKVQGLADGRGLVPIFRDILGDTETPVSAYLKLRARGRLSFLLESVEGGEKIGRYSFLGVDPFLIFRSRGQEITIEDLREGPTERYTGEPIAELRKLLARYRSVHVEGLPRFTGGAVGYVGYDAVRLTEDIPDDTEDDLGLDDVVLLFFDSLLAFDNIQHVIHLIASVHTAGDLETSYREAVDRIAFLEDALRGPAVLTQKTGTGACEVRSNTPKADYLEKVRRCRSYIVAGDILQVVLSQRFETDVTVGSLDIYRMLRVVNPSPYMFHLDLGDLKLVGTSPELLVRVEEGVVQVRPIAGTRRRGETEEEDQALEAELLGDEKERAEHIMLVDLGRNDVGRVSEYDTVRVTEQMVIERYSHVMHIVSNVEGRLREDVDSLDALFACYPAGTVSGAPKIRAMEIIDELEPTRRGPYAGAVGYFDFSGNMDTCIAIRTMMVKGKRAYVQAGGGIVYDSVPEREFEETVNKAKALFRAVEAAERGEYA
ncbi:MAG: anthranilate synthase component I [Candidatus Latescibacteria bacterium]|nr:anthranilate synthase component I [Candidatus Latescibacterota bacterium]